MSLDPKLLRINRIAVTDRPYFPCSWYLRWAFLSTFPGDVLDLDLRKNLPPHLWCLRPKIVKDIFMLSTVVLHFNEKVSLLNLPALSHILPYNFNTSPFYIDLYYCLLNLNFISELGRSLTKFENIEHTSANCDWNGLREAATNSGCPALHCFTHPN